MRDLLILLSPPIQKTSSVDLKDQVVRLHVLIFMLNGRKVNMDRLTQGYKRI